MPLAQDQSLDLLASTLPLYHTCLPGGEGGGGVEYLQGKVFIWITLELESSGQGATSFNAMRFGMNHTPGAGLIAQTIDLQSGALPLC